MIIEYNYQQVEVPQEIINYCDYFTLDAKHDDLRYIDCVYTNMGYYGNNPQKLKELRYKIMPIFD